MDCGDISFYKMNLSNMVVAAEKDFSNVAFVLLPKV